MSKNCTKCGTEISDATVFCENCGTATAQQEITAAPVPGFKPDSTGKYHWYHEMNMFTNPTVFITCFKVFALSVGIVAVILFFIMLGDGLAEAALFFLRFLGYGLVIMTVLLALGYFIYALIMGGKYIVVFEMDEQSVTHTQLDRQFQKAQVVAALTALLGAAKGSPTMLGTGILAGSRGSMTTVFSNVGSVSVKRRCGVIYLRSGSSINQIYAGKEMFDDVLQFILSQLPENVKKKGYSA